MSIHSVSISLTILLAFICCNGPESAVLRDVETYIQDRPDSAYAELLKINVGNIHKLGLRARYALLLETACDKSYNTNTNDSLIKEAYDYYAKVGTVDQRMRASYYLGVVHRNSGRYMEAAKEFKEAERFCIEAGDNHYLGLTYWQLMEVYYSNYDLVRALEYAQKEYLFFCEGGEKVSAEYARFDVALCYIGLGEWDNAFEILQELSKSEIPQIRSGALASLAKVYMFRPNSDYSRALECYNVVREDASYRFSLQDNCQLAYLSLVCGREKDSELYIDISKEQIVSSEDSVLFFNTMHDICDHVGNLPEACNYLQQTVVIQNKLVYAQLERSVTHGMETYYQESLLVEKEREKVNRVINAALLSIVLIIVIIGVIIIAEQRRRIIMDVGRIGEIQEDLALSSIKESAYSETIRAVISDKIVELDRLSRAYYEVEDVLSSNKMSEKYLLSREEILAEFKRTIKSLRDSKSTLAVLEHSLDSSENGIMQRMRAEYAEMTELDYALLVLLFSGVPVKSISFIMNMSEPSIRMRKTRYKQLFEKKSTPSSPEFIRFIS